eukprot:sb/3470517/
MLLPWCPVKGYISTISNRIVCGEYSIYYDFPVLCDDGFDKLCVYPSPFCSIHKHQLCDGKPDCENGVDEMKCGAAHRTTTKCRRRYGEQKHLNPLAILFTWRHSHLVRSPHMGITPGVYVTNLFTCSPGYIEFTDLCDKKETCGNENRICAVNRQTENIFSISPRQSVQSDPDLVTPRFSDRINFPRYRKLTVFDPDLEPTPI